MATWLTVDTDDVRHLPKHQGHPTRSIVPFEGQTDKLSQNFELGWEGFLRWMGHHDGAVTLFVISDMLNHPPFSALLTEALSQFPDRLTVGCHGHSHRSWSAWGEDITGFSEMLATSTALLKSHAGAAFRPYFRAPNGYVAPWMAKVLADHGYIVDSSVNPSWLVRKKTGGGSWTGVQQAMLEAGLVERPWLTRWTLPVNGPALFRFPLSLFASRAWKRLPRILQSHELDIVEQRGMTLTTVYCHVLDFARMNGTWTPPLPREASK